MICSRLFYKFSLLVSLFCLLYHLWFYFSFIFYFFHVSPWNKLFLMFPTVGGLCLQVTPVFLSLRPPFLLQLPSHQLPPRMHFLTNQPPVKKPTVRFVSSPDTVIIKCLNVFVSVFSQFSFLAVWGKFLPSTHFIYTLKFVFYPAVSHQAATRILHFGF